MGVSIDSLRLPEGPRLDHIAENCPLRLRRIVKWAKGYSPKTRHGGSLIESQLPFHTRPAGSRASTRKQNSSDVFRKLVDSFWLKGELGNLYVSVRRNVYARPKKNCISPLLGFELSQVPQRGECLLRFAKHPRRAIIPRSRERPRGGSIENLHAKVAKWK